MPMYQARRTTVDGVPAGWDFTESGLESAWCHPLGYCHDAYEARDRSIPWRGHHLTANEAEACFLRFRLDKKIEVHVSKDEQRKCLECGAWTQQRVVLGGSVEWYGPLCEKHQDRELIRAHYLGCRAKDGDRVCGARLIGKDLCERHAAMVGAGRRIAMADPEEL